MHFVPYVHFLDWSTERRLALILLTMKAVYTTYIFEYLVFINTFCYISHNNLSLRGSTAV